MSESPLPLPARIAGTVFATALALALLLALAAAVWVGLRGAIAVNHLLAAQSYARDAFDRIDDSATAIADITHETEAARELTSDPVWRWVEHLPWAGPQLSAVSTVADAADYIAAEALTPLAEIAATLTPAAMTPSDGRIEPSTFVAVQETAAAAAGVITAASGAVDHINDVPLVTKLRDIVADLRNTLSQAREGSDALARVALLLPAMLGADGARDYLVLFQDNAQWRSLGGTTGSQALIHTDDGAMTLVQQDHAQNFPRFDPPVLELDPELAAVYGQTAASSMPDVTQLADFSRSGPLAKAMWSQKYDDEVDGVLTIDPVAVSYLLEATGPLPLPTGETLSSENAVQLLLNEVYLRYSDPAQQNLFFDHAYRALLDALAEGRVDPATLVRALDRAGDERRILLWSAHPEDQEILDDTTLAGHLPHTDELSSTFGVFVNDGAGTKMDYYQTLETTVAWQNCSVDAAGQATGVATLTITIGNVAPTSGLPSSITGTGTDPADSGSANTIVYVYLPEGFDLTQATITGDLDFAEAVHEGRHVLSFNVTLAPGRAAIAVVTAHATFPAGARLVAQATPTADAPPVPEVVRCL